MKKAIHKLVLPAVVTLVMVTALLFPFHNVYAASHYDVIYSNLKNPINDCGTSTPENEKAKNRDIDEPLAPDMEEYGWFEEIGYVFKENDKQLCTENNLRSVGWSTQQYVTSDAQLWNFNDPVTGAHANYRGQIQLYAIWQYRVTFADENAAVLSSGFVYENATVARPSAAPKKSGYDFVGWTKDLSTKELYNFDSKVTTAFTLYPVFKPVKSPAATYVLHYDANTTDKTSAVPADQSYHAKSKATVADKLTRDGYTFQGWNSQADGKGTTYKVGASIEIVDSNITLYAMWQKNSTGGADDTVDALHTTPETGDFSLVLLCGIAGLSISALIVLSPLRKKLKSK